MNHILVTMVSSILEDSGRYWVTKYQVPGLDGGLWHTVTLVTLRLTDGDVMLTPDH
jgi:hypothetical protein